MDFFQSHQLCPSRCYLTFFHFPERSIVVKRLAGSPGLNWSNLYANKVLLQGGTHSYTLMDFSVAPNCCQPLLSYLLPFSRTFNALVKRLAGSGLKLIQPARANKVLLKVHTHSYIHWWTSFSRAKLCPNRYLTFFHFPERSIALKRLAGSPKGAEMIPTCLR
jgi:hypothetical protein